MSMTSLGPRDVIRCHRFLRSPSETIATSQSIQATRFYLHVHNSDQRHRFRLIWSMRPTNHGVISNKQHIIINTPPPLALLRANSAHYEKSHYKRS